MSTATVHTVELADWLEAHGFRVNTGRSMFGEWTAYDSGSVRVCVSIEEPTDLYRFERPGGCVLWSSQFVAEAPFAVVVAAIKAAMVEGAP